MVWARRRGAVSVRWKLMVLGAETSLSIRLHLSSTGLSPHAASRPSPVLAISGFQPSRRVTSTTSWEARGE